MLEFGNRKFMRVLSSHEVVSLFQSVDVLVICFVISCHGSSLFSYYLFFFFNKFFVMISCLTLILLKKLFF